MVAKLPLSSVANFLMDFWGTVELATEIVAYGNGFLSVALTNCPLIVMFCALMETEIRSEISNNRVCFIKVFIEISAKVVIYFIR